MYRKEIYFPKLKWERHNTFWNIHIKKELLGGTYGTISHRDYSTRVDQYSQECHQFRKQWWGLTIEVKTQENHSTCIRTIRTRPCNRAKKKKSNFSKLMSVAWWCTSVTSTFNKCQIGDCKSEVVLKANLFKQFLWKFNLN